MLCQNCQFENNLLIPLFSFFTGILLLDTFEKYQVCKTENKYK